MTDDNIISRLNFDFNAGCGRGGFETEVERFTLYDEQSVLYSLNGRYVNPVGPFKKYVVLYAKVYSMKYYSELSLEDDFWGGITKEGFLIKYMRPFLNKLRLVVEEGIKVHETNPKLFGYRVDMLREKTRTTMWDDMLESIPNLLEISRERSKGYF